MPTTRVVYNTLVDENGQPVANVPVRVYLVTHQFLTGQQIEVTPLGVVTTTTSTGYWQIGLIPNDTMEDPNSYYIVEEGAPTDRIFHRHFIRVPSGTDPLPLENARISPPYMMPGISPEQLVSGLMVEGEEPLKGTVKLVAGQGIALSQDNYQKQITIQQVPQSVQQKLAIAVNNTDYGVRSRLNFIAGANIGISAEDVPSADTVNITISSSSSGSSSVHNLLDGSVHPDTTATTVQRGMLIVGRLIGTVVKWAGLALGAAGKFLKSDGTDVVWGDVTWDDVQNRPTAFPPSPHTHDAADIASGRLSTVAIAPQWD